MLKILYFAFLFFTLPQFNPPHFAIKAPKDISQSDITKIINHLENKFSELENYWGLKEESKINIIIYPTTYDFVQGTKSRPDLSGAYLDNKIYLQPVPLLKRKGLLFSTLSHELAHAFLNQYIKEGLPNWLNEAFAVYFSDEIEGLRKRDKIAVNHFSDFEKLLNLTGDKQKTVYFYLGLTMQFFINTYSQPKVAEMLRAFSTRNKNLIISRTLGDPLDSIENKWKDYLNNYK